MSCSPTDRTDVTRFGMTSVGRHALVYALGFLLSKAVAVLMLPIYTRYLTPRDYGVMALIEMTLDLISILAGAQLALGIFRFYYKADTEPERCAVVSTALIALGLSYGAVGMASFAGASYLSRLLFTSADHAALIRIAAISFAFQGMFIVPLAYARVRDRSTLFITANAVKLAVSLALNITFLVGMGMGVRGIFLSNLVASAVVGSAVTAWALREVGLRLSGAALRSLTRYGAPLVGMSAATFTVTFADRFFLQATADERAVGLYNLAYQFSVMLVIFGFGPIELVWGPRRFAVAKAEHGRDETLARGFRLSSVMIVTMAIGISLFVGDVLWIMATPAYYSAADVVPILLIAHVLQCWASMQDIGILVRERTGLLMVINWAAALVALAGYSTLIPRYHGWGAAVATALAFGVRYSLTYVISQRLWRVQYDWGPVLRLCAIAIGLSLAALLLPDMNPIASVGIHLGILAIYFAFSWKAGVLTTSEKNLVLDRCSIARDAIGGHAGPLKRRRSKLRDVPRETIDQESGRNRGAGPEDPHAGG